MSKWSCY